MEARSYIRSTFALGEKKSAAFAFVFKRLATLSAKGVHLQIASCLENKERRFVIAVVFGSAVSNRRSLARGGLEARATYCN